MPESILILLGLSIVFTIANLFYSTHHGFLSHEHYPVLGVIGLVLHLVMWVLIVIWGLGGF